MKVLHVYRTYFPDSQGGLEEVIRQICLGTREQGIISRVFTLSDEPYPRRLPRVECEVVRVRKTFEVASCGFTLTGLRRFAKELEWADLVHYHYPWPFSDLMHLFFGHSKPAVLTYHSDIVRQKVLLYMYRPLMRRYLGAMDRIVATSPNYFATSEVLSNFTDKVEVIPIGLDESFHPPLGDTENSLTKVMEDYGSDFFLFLGLPPYYKDLQFLFDTIEGAPYKLVLVGAAQVAGELREQIQCLDSEKVIIAGNISDREKMALLQLCRAVVSPSYLRAEAFAVTLLEGAMSGRPLISVEAGSETSHVNVHYETGLVVEAGSPVALRAAMDELFWDRAKAERMGKNARLRYEALFTGLLMGGRYAKLYANVLGEMD